MPDLEVVSGATARAPLLVPLQCGLSATEHAALRATYGKCSWYGEVTLEVREGGKLRHIRLTLPVRARVEGFEGEVLLGRAGNIPSQRKRWWVVRYPAAGGGWDNRVVTRMVQVTSLGGEVVGEEHLAALEEWDRGYERSNKGSRGHALKVEDSEEDDPTPAAIPKLRTPGKGKRPRGIPEEDCTPPKRARGPSSSSPASPLREPSADWVATHFGDKWVQGLAENAADQIAAQVGTAISGAVAGNAVAMVRDALGAATAAKLAKEAEAARKDASKWSDQLGKERERTIGLQAELKTARTELVAAQGAMTALQGANERLRGERDATKALVKNLEATKAFHEGLIETLQATLGSNHELLRAGAARDQRRSTRAPPGPPKDTPSASQGSQSSQ